MTGQTPKGRCLREKAGEKECGNSDQRWRGLKHHVVFGFVVFADDVDTEGIKLGGMIFMEDFF